MKLILFLLYFLKMIICDNWAILVAGSNTYINYRHQSDVFHAYQILRKNGFSPEKIITFAFDDIANNVQNPFKGKVFNKPSGIKPGFNVYQGVFIDYKGASVDPTVFLSVLEGNKSAVAGKGSGKVLQSTKEDNIFLYFSDHGAPGLIAFPTQYLYANDLLTTFAKIKGQYNKLVFYLQACESGSMFISLSNDTKIYALSASNPHESSWATYCSPQDVVNGKHINSCLGDEFSVNFLENTEQSDIFSVTLNDQFRIIKQKTSQSHVLQWGDLTFSSDKVSEYLAFKKTINLKFGIPKITQLRRGNNKQLDLNQRLRVSSRTVKMHTLMQIFSREQTEQSFIELMNEVQSMKEYERIFKNFNKYFEGKITQKQYDPMNIRYECLKDSIDYFQSKRGRFSDYGLKYIAYLARGCELQEIQKIKERIDLCVQKNDEYVDK